MASDADSALEDIDRVVYEPPEGYVEGTNAYQFAREHGYDSLEELIEASTDDVEWFWDALPEYLGIEWYEAYDAVRDDSDGPQFTAGSYTHLTLPTKRIVQNSVV